jgi:hypothetical protein
MIIRSEITETIKEVIDLWNIDSNDFEELITVPDENFQNTVKALVKSSYLYFVMMYEESLKKLEILKNSVEVNAKKYILRHFILKVYLEGGTLSIN